MIQRIDLATGGSTEKLPPMGGIADQVHVFEEREARAINAALAAGRPLLVRGEPGTGKSQLARAAAARLQRAFVSQVVDSQTESRDLLWQFDALRRLGEAQLAGALRAEGADRESVRAELAVGRFVRPGPLWWALNWPSAADQAILAGEPTLAGDALARTNGCVVLIDEIDKAESEVPNGLLEALGAGEFKPQGRTEPVSALAPLPLVVITTNGERALPDAFVRRCLVLALFLPGDRDELLARLIERGRAHFPKAKDEVLEKAADLLIEDRDAAKQARARPLPGQAEYLDLLRAVLLQFEDDPVRQMSALSEIGEFTLKKYANL